MTATPPSASPPPSGEVERRQEALEDAVSRGESDPAVLGQLIAECGIENLEYKSAKRNLSPLEIAVCAQNTEAVRMLLTVGKASADAIFGLPCTSLCKCCYAYEDNAQMVQLLLECGANPDATTNNDTNSASCLIISVVKGNFPVVRLLLEFGADIYYEWKGSNVLGMALDFKKLDIVELFEKHEYRRAQDNRWKRFKERLELERTRATEKGGAPGSVPLDAEEAARRARVEEEATKELEAAAFKEQSRGVSGTVKGKQRPSSSPATKITSPPVGFVRPMPQPLPRPPQQPTAPQTPPPVPRDAEHSRVLEGSPETVKGCTEPPVALIQAPLLRAGEAAPDWLLPRDEVEIVDTLTEGAHGEVFTARLKSTGDMVALKKFACSDEKSRNIFRQEVSIIAKFRHENILLFLGAVDCKDMCAIVSELCSVNLMERIQTPGPISFALRVRWARDIAKGMAYMHTRTPPVVHRDLKSLNCLLDKSGTVKICDFGMSRIRQHTYIATQTISGSPSWMAPEVLRGDDFDDKSDVFSFGVVLWELITRDVPWSEKNMAQLVGLVGFAGSRLELPNPLPQDCPEEMAAMVKRCFADAKERPSFRELRIELDAILQRLEGSLD